MNTQEIILFDINEKAGLHISFCDKEVFLTTRTAEGQYDFQIQEELLIGLAAMYKEHCKRVDDK